LVSYSYGAVLDYWNEWWPGNGDPLPGALWSLTPGMPEGTTGASGTGSSRSSGSGSYADWSGDRRGRVVSVRTAIWARSDEQG
jgi:hypothetical protein